MRDLSNVQSVPGGAGPEKANAAPVDLVAEETLDGPHSVSCPEMAQPYEREIFGHLLATSKQFLPGGREREDFLSTVQGSITPDMRRTLVDWMVDVHTHFDLMPETLFLAVNLLDRYLAAVPVSRGRLQVTGAACLFIAAKYEEIVPPQVTDFQFMSGGVCDRSAILELEVAVLTRLEFRITSSSPMRLLTQLVAGMEYEWVHLKMAQYFLELTLPEYSMVARDPAEVAAAALYLTHKVFRTMAPWNEALQERSGFKVDDIKGFAREICGVLQRDPVAAAKWPAVKNKFSSKKFGAVAQMITR